MEYLFFDDVEETLKRIIRDTPNEKIRELALAELEKFQKNKQIVHENITITNGSRKVK